MLDPTVLVTPITRAPWALQYLNEDTFTPPFTEVFAFTYILRLPENRTWVLPESQKRIRSFSRLRDEHTDVVSEDGSLSIEEVRGQLQNDRKLCQLLDYLQWKASISVSRIKHTCLQAMAEL